MGGERGATQHTVQTLPEYSLYGPKRKAYECRFPSDA